MSSIMFLFIKCLHHNHWGWEFYNNMLLYFQWLPPRFCLWLLVYCVCTRLQSDTDEGDTSRSRDTAELMDLSQASQRQPNLASNRMKNKGNEFKRDSPSSSFGPRRNKKRKGSKRLTSHLIYTTASIHHLWQSKSPFFHPPKGERLVMKRGFLKEKLFILPQIKICLKLT